MACTKLLTKLCRPGLVIGQFGRISVKQSGWIQSCGFKTKTWAIEGNEIKEVEVDVPFKPAESYLTPSTQEKIYPTSSDAYDNIPVIVDGKEYTFEFGLMVQPPPVIPTIVTPDESDYMDEEKTIPDKEGDTMADYILTHFAEDFPTKDLDDPAKNPMRDIKNFPNITRTIEAEKYRLYIFPEHWFDSLYEKTGVTGPYLATALIPLFFISKEIFLVMDHSVPHGVAMFMILAIIARVYGKQANDYVTALQLKNQQWWEDWRIGSIKFLKNYVKHSENQITQTKELKNFHQALRENVQLQQEAIYRKRLMDIYKETCKKLDLQVALENAKEQFSRRHMVNWIIDKVNKGLTADKEKQVFDQCLIDLKSLANKRAGVI